MMRRGQRSESSRQQKEERYLWGGTTSRRIAAECPGDNREKIDFGVIIGRRRKDSELHQKLPM